MASVPNPLDQIRELLDDTDELILAANRVIQEEIERFLTELATPADEFTQQIIDFIESTVNGASFRVRALITQVFQKNLRTLIAAEDIAEFEREKVLSQLNAQLSGGDASIRDALSKILGTQEAIIGQGESLVDRIRGVVSGSIDSALGPIDEALSVVVRGSAELIERAIDGVGDKVAPVIAAVQQSVPTLITQLTDVIGGPNSLFVNPAGAISDALIKGIGGFFGGVFKERFDKDADSIDGFVSQLENLPLVGEIVKQYGGGQGVLALGVPGLSFAVFLGQALAISVVQSFLAGEFQKITQMSLERAEPTLLTVQDMQELLRRFGDFDAFRSELKKSGYSDERIESLSTLSRNLLGVQETLELRRREIIDEQTMIDRLNELGIRSDLVGQVAQLRFQLPSLSDVIQFSVREVFDVPLAEQFGQFEGLSPDAIESFKQEFAGFGTGPQASINAFRSISEQVGLEPKWAAAYWASHWQMPAIGQLYEMYQRFTPDKLAKEVELGRRTQAEADAIAFSLDDLQLTIRAKDYTPYWRERLNAIAYQPLTRVDLRRMHGLGLIKDEELVLRFRDLGFSPADAALNAQFVIAYNRAPDEETVAETRALTRTQVERFFKNGLIPEAETAIKLLQELDYPEETATIIIENIILERDEEERTLSIRTIRKRFETGSISYNDAVTLLDSIEIPPKQRALILADFEAELASRTRIPSRAELDKFYGENLISAELYRDGLLRLGYSEFWADKFIALNAPSGPITLRGTGEGTIEAVEENDADE